MIIDVIFLVPALFFSKPVLLALPQMAFLQVIPFQSGK